MGNDTVLADELLGVLVEGGYKEGKDTVFRRCVPEQASVQGWGV